MDYLPVFLKLADQPVLVVGGGVVALRKVELLLKAHARVRVVAPRLHRGAGAVSRCRSHRAPAGGLQPRATSMAWCLRLLRPIAPRSIAAVAAEGARRGIFVNVVDDGRSVLLSDACDHRSLAAHRSGGHFRSGPLAGAPCARADRGAAARAAGGAGALRRAAARARAASTARPATAPTLLGPAVRGPDRHAAALRAMHLRPRRCSTPSSRPLSVAHRPRRARAARSI